MIYVQGCHPRCDDMEEVPITRPNFPLKYTNTHKCLDSKMVSFSLKVRYRLHFKD